MALQAKLRKIDTTNKKELQYMCKTKNPWDLIYRILYFCAVQMGLHSSVVNQMHLTEILIKNILNFW